MGRQLQPLDVEAVTFTGDNIDDVVAFVGDDGGVHGLDGAGKLRVFFRGGRAVAVAPGESVVRWPVGTFTPRVDVLSPDKFDTMTWEV